MLIWIEWVGVAWEPELLIKQNEYFIHRVNIAMAKCPICTSDQSADMDICDCGYSFRDKQIVDKDKLLDHHQKLRKSKQWTEEVRLKQRITEIQQKKYGRYRGWSIRKTAELLNESKSLTSPDISLAMALDEYPELLESRHKSEAKKRLKAIVAGATTDIKAPKFSLEEDLHRFLETNWDTTKFGNKWELVGSKYDTGEVGEIDLLARHRKKNGWLIIHLKRELSYDETIGRILRYMGWVWENLADSRGEIEGIIISKTVDNGIRYALKSVSNLSLKIYHIDNGEFVLKKPDQAFAVAYLKTLPEFEIDKVIQELRKEVQKKKITKAN